MAHQFLGWTAHVVAAYSAYAYAHDHQECARAAGHSPERPEGAFSSRNAFGRRLAGAESATIGAFAELAPEASAGDQTQSRHPLGFGQSGSLCTFCELRLYELLRGSATRGRRDDRLRRGSCSVTPPPSPDTEPPTVESTIPSANETDVAPTIDVTATFSEDMNGNTINGKTFKLFEKGSSTKIAATVSYDAGTETAKLSPNQALTRGVNYEAVVTTGAKDLADNPLDQNSTKTGSQQKAWFFTTSD